MRSYLSFKAVYDALLTDGYSAVEKGAIIANGEIEKVLKNDWQRLLFQRLVKYKIIDGWYTKSFTEFHTVEVKDELERAKGVVQLLSFDTKFLREEKQKYKTLSNIEVARQQMSYNFQLKKDFWKKLTDIEHIAKENSNNFVEAFHKYKDLIEDNQLDFKNLDLKGWFNIHQKDIVARTFELLFVIKNLSYLTQDIKDSENIDVESLPVFMFWDQGYNEAPEIVKMTINKAREEFGDRLILLTQSNINDYIDIPEYVKKIRNTKRAFFSDWLRVNLLAKHGGIWLDSTVLVTHGLSKIITSVNSFDGILIQTFGTDKFQMSNWFLVAYQKNNYIFQVIKKLLDLYHSQYDFYEEYFMFHSFMKALAQIDRKFNSIWLLNNHLDSKNGLALEKHIYDDYTVVDFNSILKKSSIHKLSYHAYDKNRLNEKSVYNYVLKGNLS